MPYHPIGLVVGENTNEPFTVTKMLSKEETTQHWCINQGKNYPHDKAYEITLKCGKTYKTLHTQIVKCIQRGWGWNKCRNCDGNRQCDMDAPINHTLEKIPDRSDIIAPGEIYGDWEVIEFAFNAKRHNYWELHCIKCGTTKYDFASNLVANAPLGKCVCPNCTAERYAGPRAIRNWLETNNISFEKEYKFSDCVFKHELPFDFAVFKNDELKMLIEYDGEQHFKFIPAWHGDEEGFKLQQTRDNIKTAYCNKHNIPLLRIPYTEYQNIDSILVNNLIF